MSRKLSIILLTALLLGCTANPDDQAVPQPDSPLETPVIFQTVQVGGEVDTPDGVTLKLPEDVTVEGWIISDDCLGQRCAQTPALILQRKGFYLRVEADGTGYTPEMEEEKIKQAEEGFRFFEEQTGRKIKRDRDFEQ